MDAEDEDRDDVVAREIDLLSERRVPARGAFLSEMLCLKFPHLYPVLNGPVLRYLSDAGFDPPRGASEGDRYMHITQTLRASLRASLRADPTHPAKNLAELDTVIWRAYRE